MIKINNKKLIKLIENKKKILLISAEWCSPCKILKKNIKKIEKKLNLLFFNIDADKYKEYCMKLGIKFLPSLIFDLKNKKIMSGLIKIKDILKEINFKR
ncbi:thioredoxin family protein [Candidatus Carsonella ruddii]|uniref:Thioredoxin n=1 Tax=Candidatus Carsonella ruddii (Diaphorina cf. continua) TaxID=2661587 RepID=A0A7R6VYE2_CARRU|nr:thioredoxin family protein [Candidatus Carsonella ruddii (Diaphorina cf. continua)]BCG49259.1 thioredoxin [Candidatus Carsonella ruddii (Diaphorina cf. continua)]